MKDILKREILKLKDCLHVDQKILKKFLLRLNKTQGLIRSENPRDHFCAFFLPFDFKKKLIFLGHHKKAQDWIPPGGHIEINETPIKTIKREIIEELQYPLEKEKIKLFDLTIKKINNPLHICKIHWDLWYLIFMPKTDFVFDKREFYDCGWFSLKKALPLVKMENYNQTIKKLLNYYGEH